MSTQEEEPLKIPDGFVKIINDFITDILITFPEYTNIINKWWNANEILIQPNMQINIFKHCIKVFPERFFDILNKNTDIFSDTSDVNTEFLPGVVFKYYGNAIFRITPEKRFGNICNSFYFQSLTIQVM